MISAVRRWAAPGQGDDHHARPGGDQVVQGYPQGVDPALQLGDDVLLVAALVGQLDDLLGAFGGSVREPWRHRANVAGAPAGRVRRASPTPSTTSAATAARQGSARPPCAGWTVASRSRQGPACVPVASPRLIDRGAVLLQPLRVGVGHPPLLRPARRSRPRTAARTTASPAPPRSVTACMAPADTGTRWPADPSGEPRRELLQLSPHPRHARSFTPGADKYHTPPMSRDARHLTAHYWSSGRLSPRRLGRSVW